MTAAISARLIAALISVESGGRNEVIGDQGRAFGPLQITAPVVADVNRILWAKGVTVVRHTLGEANDRGSAEYMLRVYLGHYCTPRRLGHEPTDEDFARTWVGGPGGTKTSATDAYWAKVKAALARLSQPQPVEEKQ